MENNLNKLTWTIANVIDQLKNLEKKLNKCNTAINAIRLEHEQMINPSSSEKSEEYEPPKKTKRNIDITIDLCGMND
jgi:archaellum component FlaC